MSYKFNVEHRPIFDERGNAAGYEFSQITDIRDAQWLSEWLNDHGYPTRGPDQPIPDSDAWTIKVPNLESLDLLERCEQIKLCK
ncbi:MAG TPA: hypothetical protein VND64_18955 [Pirellulales bacterium]|nr:hypothetical protein [Pirellulales bacterium]